MHDDASQSTSQPSVTISRLAEQSTCPHPEAVGVRWGDPISDERKSELQGYLDRWQAETDHGERKGPFDDISLSGADVTWLAEQSGWDEYERVPNLHLEGANLAEIHLEGAKIRAVHLEGGYLHEAHLEGAGLSEAHLKGANLTEAHLERAYLLQAHLEGANLNSTHLKGTNLREAHLEQADLYQAHLEGAFLYAAHMESAYLREAHLEGARLNAAQLTDANLSRAYLENASLSEAHLERANLTRTNMKGANFFQAHLEYADLLEARLEGVILNRAHLESANLSEAHLEGALVEAHLERSALFGAHLEGANFTGAWFDSKTLLNEATLDRKTCLGDIQWGGVGAVNLTQIDWKQVSTLGDEQGVGIRSSIEDHEGAVRAYRQLAAQFRAQGMSEMADRFAERAQIRQRKLLFRQMLADWRRPWRLPGDLLRWLFSWFLTLLAGYGYHPGRSVFWYLLTIIGFTALYSRFGIIDGHAFNITEAVVFSLTSFHGRGFFPGGLPLDDPVTVIAAGEAIIGLLIEISFIATFTQRFFGSK